MTRRTNLLPADHCPSCGKEMNAATDPTDKGAAPQPGDFSICIKCGQWSVFDRKLRLRKPTEAERGEMASDPLVAKHSSAWDALQDVRPTDKRCDNCFGVWFQEGPHGGSSINVRCIECGATYYAAPGNLAWGRTFNQGPELFHGKPATLRKIFLRGVN